MCGFVGIFTANAADSPERGLLERMTSPLTHRGPDSQTVMSESGVGFGFCRLAIIDLAGGEQPIHNEDRSLTLVCNGEIYNYQELRAGLRQRGHQFRSNVDVEVLVHLYEEHGPAFVKLLNGQFAFAIHDRARGRVVLGRDQVGIAPLFYTECGGKLLFASEIKALLQHPAVKREVDFTALDQVLTFPGPVSPRTLFRGIHSVPPGHLLIADADGVRSEIYWDLEYPLAKDLEPGATPDIDALEERLQNAVARRLQADVDVGFYLSGGMDSSLIAALIGKHDAAHPTGAKRHAFSIGFNDERIDERRHQQQMAKHVDAIHHTEIFDSQSIHSRLRDAVWHAEAPLKESYNTCSLALSALVHRHALKVVLTGEGADELFGGYVGYRLDAQRRLQDDDFSLEAELARELQDSLWGDATLFYEYDYVALSETKSALYAPELAASLRTFDCTTESPVDHSKLKGRHPLHQRSYLDFKLRLADHLLSDHGDRVAYANSVEARYPFLDPQVIDWAATAPPDYLVHNAMEKYPLRCVAERHLPTEITRREKFGFVAPSSATLLRDSEPWVEDLLSYDRVKAAGYFNADTVERLKARYRQPNFQLSTTFEPDLLMPVLTFEVFRECFDIPPR
jgi:asparagine synthase (glutamine-hydrolysing)